MLYPLIEVSQVQLVQPKILKQNYGTRVGCFDQVCRGSTSYSFTYDHCNTVCSSFYPVSKLVFHCVDLVSACRVPFLCFVLSQQVQCSLLQIVVLQFSKYVTNSLLDRYNARLDFQHIVKHLSWAQQGFSGLFRVRWPKSQVNKNEYCQLQNVKFTKVKSKLMIAKLSSLIW